MKTAAETLASELLILWPKLGPSYRVVRRWAGRGGLIFIGDEEQGLDAARTVAKALRGKTVELPVAGLPKAEFNKLVGKYLYQSASDGVARNAGMDQLCLIIPRIDMQSKWLRDALKGYCELGRRPLVLLLTCSDLEWMPDYLAGHLHECRKKGATRRSPGQRALVKLSRKADDKQRSFLR